MHATTRTLTRVLTMKSVRLESNRIEMMHLIVTIATRKRERQRKKKKTGIDRAYCAINVNFVLFSSQLHFFCTLHQSADFIRAFGRVVI